MAIDPFARECLPAGVDAIGWALGQLEAVAGFEAARARAAPPGWTPRPHA